jgi:hypothetical protein
MTAIAQYNSKEFKLVLKELLSKTPEWHPLDNSIYLPREITDKYYCPSVVAFFEHRRNQFIGAK